MGPRRASGRIRGAMEGAGLLQSVDLVLTPALRVCVIAVALGAASEGAAQEQPPADDPREAVPRLLEQYSTLGEWRLPRLAATDIDALASGQSVVAVFDDSDPGGTQGSGTLRVAGLQVIPAPRLRVWLSLLGHDDRSSSRMTRALLDRRSGGAHVSYQHLDLPWPFADRQWVILSEKNAELAEASEDRIWEHRWSLLPGGEDVLEAAYADGRIPGVTRKLLDDSVYLRANSGAWILFDLGRGNTLVAAYLDVDLGGQFPDALVRSFTKRQLETVFRGLKASNPHDCDDEALATVHDGRGLPIPRHVVFATGGCRDRVLVARAPAGDAAD